MTNNVRKRQWVLAMLTANAVRTPSNYWLGAGSMLAGGPTNELAPHLLAGTALAGTVGALRRRRGPASLAVTALTAAGQAELVRRAVAAGPAVDSALDTAIGPAPRPPRRRPSPPTLASSLKFLSPLPARPRGVEVIRDVDYSDGGPGGGQADKAHRLDVYRSRSAGAAPAPVLVHVHGGMWMGSDKRYEALPLLHRMAEAGWVCVSVNYRLCPKNPFPAQIVDVKRAIAWVRTHAHEWGADPSFIAVTGGSAGGHLAALAALTPGAPEFQPGFEDADTSIQAALPQYGIYDFTADSGTGNAIKRRDRFLAPLVLKRDPHSESEKFVEASPLLRAGADAPPFFVLHGTDDTGVEVEESRNFVHRLRAVSKDTVAYAELPGAQHAYDHLDSIRSRHVVRGAERFLDWAWSRHGERAGSSR